MEFVSQFSYSLKARARNPKKVYAIDTGIISATSTSSTDDIGRRLENLIYLHLRRQFKELYYFKEKGECDFVAFVKGKATLAVQVCYKIDDDNFEREYNGLLEAMAFLKLSEGIIVTFDQKDHFEKEEYLVRILPAYEFMNTAPNTGKD